MNAGELFKVGNLAEAIEAQVKEVKANPGDHARRLFLFELLAFAGELDRAQRQVDALQYDEMELAAAVLSYRKLLDAERQRRQVFEQKGAPQFLAEPPAHVALRVQAATALQEGQVEQAGALLVRANEQLPVLRGTLNGVAFEGLRDGDDRFGTVLEVMALGQYYWVPLEQVNLLALNPPKFPRDLLWASARLELHEGAAGDVFLPALYPEAHRQSDPKLKLGRMNDWQDLGHGLVVGLGVKTFLVGEEAKCLLDWRKLEMDAPV